MRFLLLLILFFYTSLFADESRAALQSCEAFNNIKHTKNNGNQKLKEGETYQILREQNDQYYVVIPAISVPNRWVDKSCFETHALSESIKEEVPTPVVASKEQLQSSVTITTAPKEFLLALSWHNAFCQTHQARRECRRIRSVLDSDDRFVLHGLWPQPEENIYCGVPHELRQYDQNRQWNRLPEVALDEETKSALLRVMPGSASNLERHEWIKHGTCFGTDAQSYFQKAISLAQQVNRSKVGAFFAANMGKVVTLKQIRFKVDESFGKGNGKRVELVCKKGMIVELWFHLGNGSDALSTLLKDGKSVMSRCRQGRIDRAGF